MTETPATLVSKALTPIIGGVGKELSGLIGDQIRFYRWRNAVRILEKARRYAERERVAPAEIPLKFLVPYLEAASLEEVNSKSNLADMWARLLVSAIHHYDSRQRLYIDILKKLSSKDAKGIQSLYKVFKRDEIFCDDGFDPDIWNYNDIDEIRHALGLFVDELCQEALNHFSAQGLAFHAFGKKWDTKCRRVLQKTAHRVDVIPICYSMNFFYGDEMLNGYSSILQISGIEFDSITSCIALGIFERFEAVTTISSQKDRAKRVRFNLSSICLSAVGLGLMQTCCDSVGTSSGSEGSSSKPTASQTRKAGSVKQS